MLPDPPEASLPDQNPDQLEARRAYERAWKRRARAARTPEQHAAHRAAERVKERARLGADDERRAYERERKAHQRAAARSAGTYRPDPYRPRPPRPFLAIDGEGVTGPDGRHRYVLLAGSTADGRTWVVRDPDGLSSDACLSFLMRLPRDHPVAAFGLGYDLTKWVQDWPRARSRRLVPEKGEGKASYDEWTLTRRGARFTVKPTDLRKHDFPDRRRTRPPRGRQQHPYVDCWPVTVWDTFGFFQVGLTEALAAWRVGNPA